MLQRIRKVAQDNWLVTSRHSLPFWNPTRVCSAPKPFPHRLVLRMSQTQNPCEKKEEQFKPSPKKGLMQTRGIFKKTTLMEKRGMA